MEPLGAPFNRGRQLGELVALQWQEGECAPLASRLWRLPVARRREWFDLVVSPSEARDTREEPLELLGDGLIPLKPTLEANAGAAHKD